MGNEGGQAKGRYQAGVEERKGGACERRRVGGINRSKEAGAICVFGG